MRRKLRKFISILFLIIVVLSTDTTLLKVNQLLASENKYPDLIEKISKDYTRKFCNSIGFGLSKESAMKFSMSENKKIFEKRKGIQNIDKVLLANKIGIEVIDSCGYQLDLYGDKGIEEFANYYLSFDKENS